MLLYEILTVVGLFAMAYTLTQWIMD